MESESETTPLQLQEFEISTPSNRIFKRTKYLEPVVLLLFFALNLSGTILQNQIVYQTCTAVFNYNETVCSILGTEKANNESRVIEIEVQPYAAKVFMTKSLLESVVPAFGSLWLGSWSDRFGRKPIILAAYIGYAFIYIICAIISFLSTKFSINPWLYIVAIIPELILGGNCSFLLGIFSYVADITNVDQRPLRMAITEACIYIGLMLGSFLSSYIYGSTNTTTVFTISGVLIFILIFYILFFIEESLEITDMNANNLTFRSLINTDLIKDMFTACFKNRERYDRLFILLIIATLSISVYVINGTTTVFYLFVREKFEWTIKDFTIFEAVGIGVQIFGNIFVMIVLRKIFKFSVITLSLLAYASCIFNAIGKGTAFQSWHLYLSIGLGVMKGVAAPMGRSMLSSIVNTNDIGKVLSLTNTVEAILPLGADPLYTFVYSKTIKTCPGMFNIISAGFYLICFKLFLILYAIQRANIDYYYDIFL